MAHLMAGSRDSRLRAFAMRSHHFAFDQASSIGLDGQGADHRDESHVRAACFHEFVLQVLTGSVALLFNESPRQRTVRLGTGRRTAGLQAGSLAPDGSSDARGAWAPAAPPTPMSVRTQKDGPDDPHGEESLAPAAVQAPDAPGDGAHQESLESFQQVADLTADVAAELDACSRWLEARCEEGGAHDELIGRSSVFRSMMHKNPGGYCGLGGTGVPAPWGGAVE